MTITLNMDENITTVVVDVGLTGPISVWVPMPVEKVRETLKGGDFVAGDSPLGEAYVAMGGVKMLLKGKRQFNPTASDRYVSANSGLGL